MLSILFVLGKDFLEENKVMINSETKELQLGTLSDSCHTDESTANQIQITTPSKTEILSEAETTIAVKLQPPKSGKYIFEPSNKLTDEYGIRCRTIFQGGNGKLITHILNPNREAFVITKSFDIVAIEPLHKGSIVDIVTENCKEGKIPSLIESKLKEAALDGQKDIEIWKIISNFQRLFGSEIKDISTTPLVTYYIDTVDSAPIKQNP